MLRSTLLLTGALLLFFEYIIYSQGKSDGFHAPNISLALILIILPAVISSGSSLGAQIIKPIGHGKAKLQESSGARNTAYIALTIMWFLGVGLLVHRGRSAGGWPLAVGRWPLAVGGWPLAV